MTMLFKMGHLISNSLHLNFNDFHRASISSIIGGSAYLNFAYCDMSYSTCNQVPQVFRGSSICILIGNHYITAEGPLGLQSNPGKLKAQYESI